MNIPAELQALIDRANAGDQEALQQILNPQERPGRMEPVWEDCRRYPDGHSLGRNHLPAALWDAFSAGVLVDPGEVAKGVAEAWVMAEWPLLSLELPQWDDLFSYVGFVSDTGTSGHGQQRPAPPVLYRSAAPEFLPGMSWTSSLYTAWWFASRNRRDGHIPFDGVAVVEVQTAEHPWWEPYGAFHGRSEQEWVMPSDGGLDWREIGYTELDEIARKLKFEDIQRARADGEVYAGAGYSDG